MQCSNEKFRFTLRAGSTELDKGVNPIIFPITLVFLLYSIQPRDIVFVSCIWCGSKQFCRILKIPKMIRSCFEYPRPTSYIVGENLIHLF
jgi:hypothetical protein